MDAGEVVGRRTAELGEELRKVEISDLFASHPEVNGGRG
jgi:hypothetical protein